MQERKDISLAAYRRIEVMLGFDPDECPADLVQQFESVVSQAGESAMAEIAPICATGNPGPELAKVVEFAQSNGVRGHITFQIRTDPSTDDVKLPVWIRGRDLARKARAALSLNGSAVSDDVLCELFSIPMDRAIEMDNARRLPLGMIVRKSASADFKFLLRKRIRSGRRFELARNFFVLFDR